MKKIKLLFFISIITISASVSAQIGINTPNPQGIFHIDGSKDNPLTGSPTATQAANDVIVTNTGNVGIGVVPTSKFDVNGETRIRTINSILGTTSDNIVVADSNGILKVVSDLPRRSVYNTATLALAASQTLTVTDPNFSFAQINIVARNSCGKTMITTFSKYNNTLNYLGGQARDITGQFTQLDANGNNISVKFPGVTGCADGGSGSQFDFDVIVSGNTITITNRGNISKEYSIRVLSNL